MARAAGLPLTVAAAMCSLVLVAATLGCARAATGLGVSPHPRRLQGAGGGGGRSSYHSYSSSGYSSRSDYDWDYNNKSGEGDESLGSVAIIVLGVVFAYFIVVKCSNIIGAIFGMFAFALSIILASLLNLANERADGAASEEANDAGAVGKSNVVGNVPLGDASSPSGWIAAIPAVFLVCVIAFLVYSWNPPPVAQQQGLEQGTNRNASSSTALTENTNSQQRSIASGDFSDGLRQTPRFPSGKWRGYYSQYGRDHSLFSFDLFFSGLSTDVPGTLTGSGTDDVGQYNICGTFNHENGRLCFTKKYKLGTGDRRENLGHKVEYRGSVQGCFAAGIRGQWSISTSTYSGTGSFHIWPERRIPARSPATTISVSDERSPLIHGGSSSEVVEIDNLALPIGTFVATEKNECVVCFDRTVDSILRACGHIAVCRPCASRLVACPICRASIDHVEQHRAQRAASS